MEAARGCVVSKTARPSDSEKKAPPIAFLLECSDGEVSNFELARLNDVANLRHQMLAMFDCIVDVSAFAVLAAWLRTIDRQELKQQLLRSPASLEEILARAKAEIRNSGRDREELEAGPMPSPWLVRPKMPPDVARRKRCEPVMRCRERNLAEGK
jgi:hypothetical protein